MYSLEDLILISSEYEKSRVQNEQTTSGIETHSLNDCAVVVESFKKALDYYIAEQSFTGDEQNKNSYGPFYSETTIVGKGRKKRQKIIAGIEIKESAFSRYLEDCLGCEGRIRFEFEMMPGAEFFLRIEQIFDEIEKAINQLINAFKPNEKFIDQLCALIGILLNIHCPQDLINLALAIQLLLTQKLSLLLNIKINWWGLFGFAIKWFLDLLSNLIEQLANILEAPLKCLLSAMTAGLQVLRAFDAAFDTKDNINSLKSVLDITPTGVVNINIEGNEYIFPAPKRYAVTDPELIGAAMIPERLPAAKERKTGEQLYQEYLDAIANEQNAKTSSDDEKIQSANQLEKGSNSSALDAKISNQVFFREIGMGISANAEQTQKATFIELPQPSILDMSLPEQIIVLTKQAIDYIESIKTKIQLALKNLNLIIKGNKILEIEILASVKFLTSIIALLLYLGQLENIKDICRDETSRNDIQNLIASVTGAENVVVKEKNGDFSVSYEINGEEKESTIASCMTAKKQADEAKAKLENLLTQFNQRQI